MLGLVAILVGLGYFDNYLVDNRSCVIVGAQATAARLSQESVAAREMIARFAQRRGRDPESVAADATYGNGEFLPWLQERARSCSLAMEQSLFSKLLCRRIGTTLRAFRSE